MFGYFRYILALAVMMSHMGYNYHGFYPGPVAVISFYILAGYVVTHLLLNVFQHGNFLIMRFYIERLLRIYPLYLYFIAITLLFVLITGYADPQVKWNTLLGNLLIIPLNYYMYWDNGILHANNNSLIPLAWSLGTELQAYLVLPVIIFSRTWKVILSVISLSVFLIAHSNIINPDYFGYRLLPGVLFIFVLGHCIYKSIHLKDQLDLFDKIFPKACLIVCILWLTIKPLLGYYTHIYSLEVMIGIVIGYPIVLYLASCRVKWRFNHLIGKLSYGIFLGHFLCMWTMIYFFPAIPIKSIMGFAYICILSTGISYVGVKLFEENIFKIRRRFALGNEQSESRKNGMHP